MKGMKKIIIVAFILLLIPILAYNYLESQCPREYPSRTSFVVHFEKDSNIELLNVLARELERDNAIRAHGGVSVLSRDIVFKEWEARLHEDDKVALKLSREYPIADMARPQINFEIEFNEWNDVVKEESLSIIKEKAEVYNLLISGIEMDMQILEEQLSLVDKYCMSTPLLGGGI